MCVFIFLRNSSEVEEHVDEDVNAGNIAGYDRVRAAPPRSRIFPPRPRCRVGKSEFKSMFLAHFPSFRNRQSFWFVGSLRWVPSLSFSLCLRHSPTRAAAPSRRVRLGPVRRRRRLRPWPRPLSPRCLPAVPFPQRSLSLSLSLSLSVM